MPEKYLYGPFANWDDVSTYPDPNNTNNAKWAWEFLRRNPCYQHEWKLVKERAEELGAKANNIDPPKVDGETPEEYFSRMIFEEDMLDPETNRIDWSKVSPHPSIVALEWGIESMCDPCDESPINLYFINTPSVLLGATHPKNHRWWDFTVTLDLTNNIDAQLRIIRREFIKRKNKLSQNGFSLPLASKRIIKNSKDLLVDYLRILDAEQVGVPIKDRAKIVSGRPSEVLKAALEYRDIKYKLLPSKE